MLQGKFLTKQGETALAVANFLIGLKLGARLPNINAIFAQSWASVRARLSGA